MECTACGGEGCEACRKDGRIRIAGCPLEIVPSDVWDTIRLAVMFDGKGTPPIAGGVLDQANAFLEAWRVVTSAIAFWEERFSQQSRR